MIGYDLIWEEHIGYKDGLYLFLSKTDDDCIMNFVKDKTIVDSRDINMCANEMLGFITTIDKDQLYTKLDRIIKIRKIKKRYGL
jgi:hypothetical protein